MNLSINGEKKQLTGKTVAQVLQECGFDANKIAVAINTEFVSRSDYETHLLDENDEVDILTAVQGG